MPLGSYPLCSANIALAQAPVLSVGKVFFNKNHTTLLFTFLSPFTRNTFDISPINAPILSYDWLRMVLDAINQPQQRIDDF